VGLTGAALLLAAITTGPAVGTKAPEFSLIDQAGQTRAFHDLTGRKGLLLVFYRSADW